MISRVRRGLPGVAPLLAVLAFNAWHLRSELRPAHYLHDGSFHQAYLRWAVERISHGHSPLDGIFPDLGLGFPIFQHYQVGPYLLTAPVAWLLGVAGTFSVVLYLLLVLWPVCVYAMARLMEFDRATAVAAGVVAPFVISVPGYGFELPSYVWRGYGMWTQAWGMWLLALSVGWGWRAVTRGRSLAVGAGLVALTLTSHLLTGLLGLALLGVWTLVGGAPRATRLRRTVALVGGGMVAAAWLIVPSYLDKEGTSFVNPKGTHWRDSYGVRKVLSWLAGGELFDTGRFPVLTLLGAVGLVVLVARARRAANARAVLAMFGLSLALFCGTTLVGPVLDRLPGREVLFLHRAIAGVHLAGIVVAGVGAAAAARLAQRLATGAALRGIGAVAALAARRRAAAEAEEAAAPAEVPADGPVPAHQRIRTIRIDARRPRAWAIRGPGAARAAATGLVVGVGVVALAPAWTQLGRYLEDQTDWVNQQHQYDSGDGRDFAALAALAGSSGGRVYAGSRGNWGDDYQLGFVPAHIELTNLGVPGFGFTGRAPTHIDEAEGRFDGEDPRMAELFDVRWQIRPADRAGPPGAQLVASRGRHRLWHTDTGGPVLLSSDVTAPGAANPARGPVGQVVSASAAPTGDRYAAVVEAARDSVLVVKTSTHPRWTARIDGRAVAALPVHPGLVAVRVPAGTHHIEVTFAGFPRLPRLGLITLGVAVLGALALADRARRRRPAIPVPPPDMSSGPGTPEAEAAASPAVEAPYLPDAASVELEAQATGGPGVPGHGST